MLERFSSIFYATSRVVPSRLFATCHTEKLTFANSVRLHSLTTLLEWPKPEERFPWEVVDFRLGEGEGGGAKLFEYKRSRKSWIRSNKLDADSPVLYPVAASVLSTPLLRTQEAYSVTAECALCKVSVCTHCSLTGLHLHNVRSEICSSYPQQSLLMSRGKQL